jgi:hypothetical protein
MYRPIERWLKGLRDAFFDRESKLEDMLRKLRQLETIEQQLLSAIADAKLNEGIRAAERETRASWTCGHELSSI